MRRSIANRRPAHSPSAGLSMSWLGRALDRRRVRRPAVHRPLTTAALLVGFLATAAGGTGELQAQSTYFPGPDAEWQTRRPEQVGMNAARLAEAVRFAQEIETAGPRDLELGHILGSFSREPFGEAIGPFKERGEPTGVILRNGYIVAEWGEPFRVDQTFSVTKSFLSATVGLAWDRGLIPDIHAPVHESMAPIFVLQPECVDAGRGTRAESRAHPSIPAPFEPFASEHSRRITWDHLLRQTSDWEGMLWCKPDWSDRASRTPSEWLTRERHEPGTVYQYNDVRVNLLALAALNIWRRPLPEILREELMDPIDASPTWRWYGYDNSWVVMDGAMVQSVSGGAHWGGGMFISARDQARFGYLHLRDGRWRDRQILSPEWLAMARTPGTANAGYGFMNFFLNTDRRALPSAPEEAYYHAGAGANIIYVDPVHDLVVVTRWIRTNALDELIGKVLAAVED